MFCCTKQSHAQFKLRYTCLNNLENHLKGDKNAFIKEILENISPYVENIEVRMDSDYLYPFLPP